MIRVITRLAPSTYYIDKDGETGLEYELLSRFARELGVDYELVIVNNTADIAQLISTNQADLAAVGMIHPTDNDQRLVFGPGYQWVTKQVVYRNGQSKPHNLGEMYPHILHLSEGMLQSAVLEQYRRRYPTLAWEIHPDKSTYELLQMVERGEIRYTVAYSNELAHARLLNPEIRTAFDISSQQPLSWLLKLEDHDDSLLQSVQQFYQKITADGRLAELIQQFYGPVEFFDYVDSRKFIDRYHRRLRELKPLFQAAAAEFAFDWRLLAALSYQESHWDPMARSATGVRGIMMLTRATARHVGVTDRLDAQQSIQGGANYLRQLAEKIPARIGEPDRTWFMLAAYNVGFGHLEDARVLTQKQGADPDSWDAVKTHLPLLSKKSWYAQTRYGYARGHEPVQFVKNIRKYYNVLVQLTQEQAKPGDQLVEYQIIDSPVL